MVCYAFSFVADTTSVYDPCWSVSPMIIAPYLALGCGDAALPARQVIQTSMRLKYEPASEPLHICVVAHSSNARMLSAVSAHASDA